MQHKPKEQGTTALFRNRILEKMLKNVLTEQKVELNNNDNIKIENLFYRFGRIALYQFHTRIYHRPWWHWRFLYWNYFLDMV